MKFIRGCVYFGLVATLALLILFGIVTDRSYTGIHASIRYRVENIFEDMPISPHIRQAHFYYLRATNRAHFNEVTFLTDGRLMLDNLDPHYFLYERADGIIALGDYLSRRDIPFVYVRIASKMEDNSVLPLAFSDNHSIEYSDRLINLISEAGIDTIDLRAEMMRENKDFATAFFRMDHHWTAETALWATEIIGNHIVDQYGFEIDLGMWDYSQFESITFERAFQGYEVSFVHGYHLYEDITVLLPEFETELVVEDVYGNILATGDFANAFVPRAREENVERFEYIDMTIPFYTFVRITNLMANNDKRVLFITESNGMLQATFMSLGFESLHVVYLMNMVTPGVLWNTLNMYDYDIVIMAVSDVVIAQENRPVFYQDRLYLGHPPY